MYEELYESIPDAQAYWEKLGINRPQLPLCVEDLNCIVFAHQSHIPFENLDVCDLHRPISLGIGDLFGKIIAGQRGGYCFELNALFEALLRDLGMDVMPCLGRSLKNRGYVYPITHRAMIVELKGQRYILDVGYGGPAPSCAIPLVDGAEIDSRGQLFRVEARQGGWWHIIYCGNAEKIVQARLAGEKVEEVPSFAILDAPQNAVDFVPLSYYCSTHSDSVFTQFRMINKRTETGSVSVTDNVFMQVDGCEKKSKTIDSEQEFQMILEKYFGIVLAG